MATKPASRRVTKALPRNGRWVAQYALPGLVPAVVRAEGGAVLTFDSEYEAEVAAMRACLDLFDRRTYDDRKAGVYHRLPGARLAMLLNDINITPTYFAEIAGVPQARVMKWLDGEQDIPHSVHVLAKLMAANDDNFRLAERITEECIDGEIPTAT